MTSTTVPWAGANSRGLALTQVAGHTLSSTFATDHSYPVTQDTTNGMSGGYINHVILSRCEKVDEVEQVLRDTNNGGGFQGSTARNTSTIIAVFDRWGNAAIFELDGDSFTRDNLTASYTQDGNGYYTSAHNDDKDTTNPADGAYSGYDWRNNFSKVAWTKSSGFPYLVDSQLTTVYTDPNTGADSVVNSGSTPDGIHDWEFSTSAVMRHTRTGIRLDDPHLKDYRYFIHKYVGSYGLGQLNDLETLGKNIGELPTDIYSTEKPTGYHINRFVSTFGAVFAGTKVASPVCDPYDGKLIASWVCLGEPTMGLFVPVFPYAEELPTALDDLHAAINDKRHLVYSYTDDAADGYSAGRNLDHSIDTVALSGPDGYYGEGGIQKYTFAIENWAFDQFDGFMASLRDGTRSTTTLRTDMRDWQKSIIGAMKTFYTSSRWPNTYEAESWANTLTGGASRVKNPNMFWGGKVIGLGGGANNDLTFEKIRVDSAGIYDVKIHYTCTSTRDLYLSVNGGTATALSFPSTGSADVLGTKTVSVALGSGDNSLRFSNNATSVTPGLDRLEILNPDIIVDNGATGFTTAGSGWNSQSGVTGFYGSDYLSDGTTAADASTKCAKWTPTINVPGLYKVYLRWSANSARPDAAPVEVAYDGGTDTSKTVNQQANGGQWVEIGTYLFSTGTSNHLLLRCTDVGYTIADAARFEKQL